MSESSTPPSNIIKRKWLPYQPGSKPISILQFNCLADVLSDGFPNTDPEVLPWEYRWNLIKQVLTEHNYKLIALQEVDHFDEFEMFLETKGYEGRFMYRGNPSEESSDPKRMGIALFWHTSLFSLCTEPGSVAYAEFEGKRFGMNCYLKYSQQEIDCSAIFLVSVVHLKAKPGFEAHRVQQLRALQKSHEPGVDLMLIVGDFNEIPANIKTMCGKSVYPASTWTTWKVRETEVKRQIDYIFFLNNGLREFYPLATLEIPSLSLFPRALPSHTYPSDHIAIAFKFSIVP